MGYTGIIYETKGGNAQLQRRYNTMKSIAQRNGVAETPEGAPLYLTAFNHTIDFLSRPLYATAGAADVVFGKPAKGREGESIGGRVLRETLSGAFGLKGDKEFFGDVLEQAGVGDATLSQLIGENALTHHWDPGARGTVGLALDVFGDPLTYVGLGPLRRGATLISRGGKVQITKKAEEALGVLINNQTATLAKRLGRLRAASKAEGGVLTAAERRAAGESAERAWMEAVEAGGDARARMYASIEAEAYERGWLSARSVADGGEMRKFVLDISRDSAEHKMSRVLDGRASVDEMRDVLKAAGLNPKAANLAEEAQKLIAPNVVSYWLPGAGRVKLLDLGPSGTASRFRHTLTDPISKRVVDILEHHRSTKAMLDGARQLKSTVANHVDKMFNAQTLNARKLGEYTDMIVKWKGNRAVQLKRLESWLQDALHGVNTPEVNYALAHALDAPGRETYQAYTRAALDAGLSRQRAQEVFVDMRQRLDEWGINDMRNGVLLTEQIQALHGRYFPHVIEGFDKMPEATRERVLDFWGKQGGRRGVSVSLGPYEERRVFDTLAETEEWVEAANKAFGTNLKVSTNVFDVMAHRGHATIEAATLTEFLNGVKSRFAKNVGAHEAGVVGALLPDLIRHMDLGELTEEEAKILNKHLERSETAVSDTVDAFFEQSRREVVYDDAHGEKVARAMASATQAQFRQHVVVNGRNFGAGWETTVKNAAKYMTTKEPEEFTEDMVRLVEHLDDLAGNPKVYLVPRRTVPAGGMFAAGFYNHTDEVVVLAGSGMHGQTFVHEMTHAATAKRVAELEKASRIPGFTPTSRVSEKDLRTFRFLERLTQKTPTRTKIVKAMGLHGNTKPYAFNNVRELIAETFANRELQEGMAKVQLTAAEKKMSGLEGVTNLWDWFKGAVRNLLGLEAVDDSVLEHVIRATEDLTGVTPPPAANRVIKEAIEESGPIFRTPRERVAREFEGRTNVQRARELRKRAKELDVTAAEKRLRRAEERLKKAGVREGGRNTAEIARVKRAQRQQDLVTKKLDEVGQAKLRRLKRIFDEEERDIIAQQPELGIDLAKNQRAEKYAQTKRDAIRRLQKKRSRVLLRTERELGSDMRELAEAVSRLREYNIDIGKIKYAKQRFSEEATRLEREVAKAHEAAVAARAKAAELRAEAAELMSGEKKLKVAELKARELRELEELPQHIQAAFMRQVLHNVKNLNHLGNVLNKYESIWRRIAPEALEESREAIKKAAIDSRVSPFIGSGGKLQDWQKVTIKVGKHRTESYELPQGIAEDLARWNERFLQSEEVRGLLRIFDMLTNTFKRGVTMPFPAFHFRNGYSNVWQSALDITLQAMNPQRHYEAMRLMLGGTAAGRKLGLEELTIVDKWGNHYTSAHIRSLMEAYQIKVDYKQLAEIIEGKHKMHRASGFKLLDNLRRGVEGVGPTIETEARAMHFITLLRRGLSPADAAARVKKFLFDYTALSNFEKQWMRRIIPFYTWQSKNIRLIVNNLATRPGLAAAGVRPLMQDRGPDSDLLPEYLRGDLRVRLEPGPGKAAMWLTGIDMPIQNLEMLFRGDLERTMRSNISMINPLIKGWFELGFNQEAFTGREIKGAQEMWKVGPLLEKFPEPMREFFELQTYMDGNGRKRYLANGTRVYLVFKSWALSRFLSTGADFTRLIQEDSGVLDWWRLFTGLSFREYDLDEKQGRLLRARYEKLEQQMLKRGLYREYEDAYARPDLAEQVKNTKQRGLGQYVTIGQ